MKELVERIKKHKGSWRHKNGRVYDVLHITNLKASDHEEYPITVVYIDSEENVWSKSPEAFLKNRKEEPNKCACCGTTENLHYENSWYGWRCGKHACQVY